MEPLLTPPDVAEKLGIPIRTLDQWRYVGKGPRCLKVGRHIRYRPIDVEHWVAAQERTK